MYCSKCGKQIDNSAVVCPSCGCPTPNYVPQGALQSKPNVDVFRLLEEAKKMATISIIGGIFIPLLGWICGALGLMKCNSIYSVSPNDKRADDVRKKCITGIIIASVMFVIGLIAAVVLIFCADDIFYDLYY